MNKEFFDIQLEIKAEDIMEDGTFTGYGSTFGGSPDSYNDIIERGAFLKSLAKGGRNGFGIAMLWQHDSSKIPGKWLSIEENNKGLKVKGQLALETQLGHDTYELLKFKAPLGLSIGFTVIDSELDKKKRIRYIKEANLWEISIVTFPANIQAKINNVKSMENIKTERELETHLRELGMSKNETLIIVKMCKPYLRELDIKEKEAKDNKEQINNILNTLKELNNNFKNKGE
jgi:HK97 family phage prohead protease